MDPLTKALGGDPITALARLLTNYQLATTDDLDEDEALWDDHLRGLQLALEIPSEKVGPLLEASMNCYAVAQLTRRAVARAIPNHWAARYHGKWCTHMEALFKHGVVITVRFAHVMSLMCCWKRPYGAIAHLQAHLKSGTPLTLGKLNISISAAGAAILRERSRGNRNAWTTYHELATRLLTAGASPTHAPDRGHPFIYYMLQANDFMGLALIYALTDVNTDTHVTSENHPYLKSTVENIALSPEARLGLHTFTTFSASSKWVVLLKAKAPLSMLRLLVKVGWVTPHGCVEAYVRQAMDNLAGQWNSFILGSTPGRNVDAVHETLVKARSALHADNLTIADCKEIETTMAKQMHPHLCSIGNWYVRASLPICEAPYGSYLGDDYDAMETTLLCLNRYLPAEIGRLVSSSFCRNS